MTKRSRRSPRSRPARVFISYSHQNAAQRAALEKVLGKTFEVRCDTGVEEGAQVHRDISHTVNWADIVVPIVTKEWLDSHECRDEMVRAHERRKVIVPFRREGITNDGPPKVPFFLHEVQHIEWNDRDIEDKSRKLAERLEKLGVQAQWKQDSYRLIRLMGDIVQGTAPVPAWQGSLAKSILTLSEQQLRQVLQVGDCVFSVSHEQSYLRFAEPIFRHTDAIIAICIASISTFWTNNDFIKESIDYLNSQKLSAKSINRLFVFESPAEANAFKNILQAHDDQYGRRAKSGVYLCSKEAYMRFVRAWDPGADERRLREDFGILSFPDSPRQMRAVLNERQFRYRCYDTSDPTDVNRGLELRNTVVEECFSRLCRLAPGEQDPATEIARWDPKWIDDPPSFARGLDVLFPNYDGASVHHFVALRPEEGTLDLDAHLYGLVERLTAQRLALQIQNIAISPRDEAQAVDGRFSGALAIQSDYAYILHFQFQNRRALRHYYQHEVHSVERERLYICLNPAIESAFKALHSLRDHEARVRNFHLIENAMTTGGFVRRYDVRSGVPTSEVVRTPGVPYGRFAT